MRNELPDKRLQGFVEQVKGRNPVSDGKEFEATVMRSVPGRSWVYKIPDSPVGRMFPAFLSAAGINPGSPLGKRLLKASRLLFPGNSPISDLVLSVPLRSGGSLVFLLECKERKGSFSFDDKEKKKSERRVTHADNDAIHGTGYLFQFDGASHAWLVPDAEIQEMVQVLGKKSIREKDLITQERMARPIWRIPQDVNRGRTRLYLDLSLFEDEEIWR